MSKLLGFPPNQAALILSEGADWVCSITVKGEEWPVGSEAWVEFPEFPSVQWDATVTVDDVEHASTASFVIQSDETGIADIPNGTKYRLYLQYATSPTTEYLWFTGKVQRRD